MPKAEGSAERCLPDIDLIEPQKNMAFGCPPKEGQARLEAVGFRKIFASKNESILRKEIIGVNFVADGTLASRCCLCLRSISVIVSVFPKNLPELSRLCRDQEPVPGSCAI